MRFSESERQEDRLRGLNPADTQNLTKLSIVPNENVCHQDRSSRHESDLASPSDSRSYSIYILLRKRFNMSLEIASLRLHWNYFLALESDLGVASRYVEFNIQNCEVYSIEFAHLLFAAASEIDVVAKLLCENLMPRAPHKNINDYKKILLPLFQNFLRLELI